MSANHKKEKKSKNHNEDLETMLAEDEEEENLIVEMTDEEGNVYLYEEEMIIPIDDKKFALLVALPFDDDEEGHQHHEHSCDCGCDEDDVIIAKIVTNEDGEEEYIEPSDEEFEMVRNAYNDFFSEQLEEEQAQDE